MIAALTPEWHAARRSGIGASELGVLFGCDPYRSQLELYAMKVGELRDEETEEMRMGRLLEPTLLRLFERETRTCARERQTLTVDDAAPHLFATPDAIYDKPLLCFHAGTCACHPFDGAGLLETKATSEPAPPDDLPPLRWILQVQAQLACMGVQHGKIAALHQSTRFRVYDVPRRDDVIQAIRERVEWWWWRYVRRGEPPRDSAQPLPMSILLALYPRDVPGKTVVLPPEAAQWDDRIAELNRTIRTAEHNRDEYKAWIAEAMGDAESGTIAGREGYWRWKAHDRDAYVVEAQSVRQLRRMKR